MLCDVIAEREARHNGCQRDTREQQGVLLDHCCAQSNIFATLLCTPGADVFEGRAQEARGLLLLFYLCCKQTLCGFHHCWSHTKARTDQGRPLLGDGKTDARLMETEVGVCVVRLFQKKLQAEPSCASQEL